MLIGSHRKLSNNPSFTGLNLKVANLNLDGVSNFLKASGCVHQLYHDDLARPCPGEQQADQPATGLVAPNKICPATPSKALFLP